MAQIFYKENYYALVICINKNITVDKALKKMGIESRVKDYKKKDIPKEELERLYNVELKTQREIANMYDTTQSNIADLVKKYGIAASEKHVNKRQKHADSRKFTREQIYDLYWNQDRGLKEIGKMLDVNAFTVRKFMVNNNIELRGKGRRKKVD